MASKRGETGGTVAGAPAQSVRAVAPPSPVQAEAPPPPQPAAPSAKRLSVIWLRETRRKAEKV